MRKHTDWWPSTRAGQLEMMAKWVDVIPSNIKKWKIPQEDLRHSFLLTRKKDYIQFTPADGGKVCYMAAQVENKRKKGPWGPMTSKTIPE